MYSVKSSEPFLKLFPEPEGVFENEPERYARHLHPLVTIDLAALKIGLQGFLHAVCPKDPCDGYLGDWCADYHNDYLRKNWIGFRLTPNNKYELLGDFRFFGLEGIDENGPHREIREELEEHYKFLDERYQEKKEIYKKFGRLHSGRAPFSPDSKEPSAMVQLGGSIISADHIYQEIGADRADNDTGAYQYIRETGEMKRKDGVDFIFIGKISCYGYGANGDMIFMFFDPVDRVVMQTFYWG